MRFDLKTAGNATTRRNKSVEQDYVIDRLELRVGFDSNITAAFEYVTNVFLKRTIIVSEVNNIRIS